MWHSFLGGRKRGTEEEKAEEGLERKALEGLKSATGSEDYSGATQVLGATGVTRVRWNEWRWGEWRECGFGGLPPVVVTPFGRLLLGPTTMERLRLWRDCTPRHQKPRDHVPWPWKPKYGTSFVTCACLVSHRVWTQGGHFVYANRGLKIQNFAWEAGLSDLAHPNYDKKSGFQLLLKNSLWSLMQGFFRKCH